MKRLEPSKIYSIIGFALLFHVFLWVFFIPWLFGTLSGWKELAKTRSFTGPIPSAYRWNHCSIPNLNMRRAVTVALDEKGMYFELPMIARIGNSNLFFPWSDISVENSKLVFKKTVAMSFRNSDSIFHFYPEQAEEFKKAAGPLWPLK